MYEYNAQFIKILKKNYIYLDVDLGLGVHKRQVFKLYGIHFTNQRKAKKLIEQTLKQDVLLSVYTGRKHDYGKYYAYIGFLGEDRPYRLNEILIEAKVASSGDEAKEAKPLRGQLQLYGMKFEVKNEMSKM